MDSLLTAASSTKIKSKAAAESDVTLRRSFDEPLKFLPVAFMLSIIVFLWCVYVMGHCLPLLQSEATAIRGWVYLVLFNILAVLLLSCYTRSVFTHPGSIPDKETSPDGTAWEVDAMDKRLPGNMEGQIFLEKKRLGARRDCKWCGKYKPDRCHHCRVCRTCVLKMDHHCPWIYNCVGFRNFKYFFLLIVYSCLSLHFMTWTMIPTVSGAMSDRGTPFLRMFVMLFGLTLAGFIACLLTMFLSFHIYLMLNAMTTIEFCEKSKRRNYVSPSYSRGYLGDIKAVLGDDVFLWFLPMSPPSGDGVSFVTEESPLRYVEEGHEIRRKVHAKTGPSTAPIPDAPRQATAGELEVDPLIAED